MSVRHEIGRAVLALFAIQVVTSFGAIALLGRGGGGAIAMAGAWSMVLLALLGLGASAFVYRRLLQRVAAPVAQIDEALGGFGRGDGFRRPKLGAAPFELERIAAAVSALMDPRGEGEADPRAIAAADRAALLHLLDGMPAPALVVNRLGIPTAASASALSRLETDATGDLRRSLEAAVSGSHPQAVASATPIAQTTLFLCTLR